MDFSSSDDDDEDQDHMAQSQNTFVSVSAPGKPYCRYQGSYLFNLIKLLNEAARMGVDDVIRWHPKISNAFQIKWDDIHNVSGKFDSVHKVLVQYKLSRASNRKKCVRPTMNRKLREWNFTMIPIHTYWVTYVYQNEQFCAEYQHGQLPTSRREKYRSI